MLRHLTLLCLITSLSVNAHPHAWTDIKTEIMSEGEIITGLRMEWTFDAMTSAYMLDEEDMSEQARESTLQAIADSVMDNMLYEHYFTYFLDGENPIRYKEVKTSSLIQHRGKLTLHFDLMLVNPQPTQGKKLKLMIFEPSYYVEMSWRSPHQVTLGQSLASTCRIDLVEPNPTPEQMAYAMSLPMDADPDNALGQLFTQHAYIDCRG
ncbi:DUF1007 family protein [Vibrio sp. SCSIO 43136]|nr:DUF1007 family protein [Vibrio sp. SCSIO 43136]